MTHQEGEARVKSLQKQFLTWVENHPHLGLLDHVRFNQMRRQAMASTFHAFKLGRVGIQHERPISMWNDFFGWAKLSGLPPELELEVQAKCFLISLEAFRAGAMVTGYEEAACNTA